MGLESVVKLTPELIADFKKKKILREQEEELELDSINPGEKDIGNLTNEERDIYIEMAFLEGDLSEWSKELSARTFERFAEATRESDTPDDLPENISKKIAFDNEEEAEEFFREMCRLDYLKALFWWNVRERFNAFGLRLGIRANYVVVSVGFKYKKDE